MKNLIPNNLSLRTTQSGDLGTALRSFRQTVDNNTLERLVKDYVNGTARLRKGTQRLDNNGRNLFAVVRHSMTNYDVVRRGLNQDDYKLFRDAVNGAVFDVLATLHSEAKSEKDLIKSLVADKVRMQAQIDALQNAVNNVVEAALDEDCLTVVDELSAVATV